MDDDEEDDNDEMDRPAELPKHPMQDAQFSEGIIIPTTWTWPGYYPGSGSG